MPRFVRFSLFALLVAFAVNGCVDREHPMDPLDTRLSPELAVGNRAFQDPTRDLPVKNRFTIDVEGDGAFRPNLPVTLRVRVTGLSDVPGTRLRVVLPEVSAALSSEWGAGFRYRVGVPAAPALMHTLDVSRGSTQEYNVSVQVPAPGYYHVVTTLQAPDDFPRVEDGQWARNTMVVEGWLLITEQGGRYTQEFDRALIPAGNLPVGGPFRGPIRRQRAPSSEEPDLNLPSHGPSVGGERGSSNTTSASMWYDNITYQVLYYHALDEEYQPVDGAYYSVEACEREEMQFYCEEYQFEEIASGYTNSSGYFSFTCEGDEYQGDASTYSVTKFRVNGGVEGFEGEVEDDCGYSFQVVLPASKAQVYLNLRETNDGAASLFGETRSFIEVWQTGSDSFYDPNDDEITIGNDDVWDEWGAFVAAHEYGHAFHNETLSGNEGSGNCPDPHFIDTESNLKCAFSEGFANFFGAATRPDLGSFYWREYMEDDDAFPGCVSRSSSPPYSCTGGTSYEGSIIEGAFAAFLYDLADNGVEAHDSINGSGSYVADIIETCQREYDNSQWDRADGPDHVAFCVENAINPDSLFTVRGWYPTDYYEAATEPGSWTAARAHNAWVWNMYDKR